jgi:hypothetical protein
LKKNILFAMCILALAGVLAVWAAFSRSGGATARVDIANGESMDIPLAQDQVVTFEANGIPVTLEVSDGAIRFINSQCADHVCEGFGWLRKEHDQAICMPAGVVVTLEGVEDIDG